MSNKNSRKLSINRGKQQEMTRADILSLIWKYTLKQNMKNIITDVNTTSQIKFELQKTGQCPYIFQDFLCTRIFMSDSNM